MKIGILKEPGFENRVAMAPDTVGSLIKEKNEVFIEKGAGEKAFYTDEAYKEQGATILERDILLKSCHALLSITPPAQEELVKIPTNTVLISVFNPFFNKDIVEQLAQQGLTSFSMDFLPRTTRAQAMDILSSMATVAGYKAVIEAAGQLPQFFPMFMSAAGTIKPAKVLILGAGVAGLQAVSIARKLGAVVYVFDVRSAVKEEVQSLGGKFVEVEGAIDDTSAGGYAVEQDEVFKQKQANAIHQQAVLSHVVICTAQIPGKRAPLLIKKETVEAMGQGSVIIDLAASTGGNCELTENNKTIVKHGVKIIGKSNFPSEMPRDASQMFGKNLYNFIQLLIGENKELVLNFDDEIVRGSCITHNKQIVNERIKNIF
jgi:H+-translocating NAD(P) transhydrogenase subunit alpha